MTERERNVVVKATAFVRACERNAPLSEETKYHGELQAAVNALTALDAAPPPGVGPTAESEAKPEYRTVTDPQEILAVLDWLPQDAKAKVWGKHAGPFEGRVNRKASGRIVVECAGTGEWRESIVQLEYRLSDDPQATPAGETVKSTKDAADLCRYRYDTLASRVAEVERQNAALRRDVGNIDIAVKALIHIAGKERVAGVIRAASTTTPAPDALPFGCVAHQYPSERWSIRTADGEWFWAHKAKEWVDTNEHCVGTHDTAANALADFHATNGGKVPPPGHKPASEGRYRVVANLNTIGHASVRRVSDGKWFADVGRWESHDAVALDFPEDIAIAVRDALEARNA